MTISPRLKTVLEAGSTVALFPLLADWPKDELKALIQDVDAYYTEANLALLEGYKGLVLKPENFFSGSRSKALDAAKRDADMQTFALCSEITSVALFYLGDSEDGER